MKILVLNGPNLNLLGSREPEVYGSDTLADLERMLFRWGDDLGMDVETKHSNHEGEMIDAIQASDASGIVLNAAALTHTSRALGDAIRARAIPTVEVHISNIKEREPWRSVSLVSEACARTIYGRGLIGYRDALRHLKHRFEVPATSVRYGSHNSSFGDLRGEGDHLFVLVHGGFWRQEWESDTMESLAVDLSRRGHQTWNLEYRRLGDGGGWPGSFHDVLTALDFVPQLKAPASKITVIGHSAGAHMAMWAVPRASTVIDKVAALAPVTDLDDLARSNRFGVAEARSLLDAGARSVPDPGRIHTLLIHGTEDRHVPYAESLSFGNRLGLELTPTNTGHFELLDPTQPYWDQLVDSL
ncbi:MAG: type II 3-dehydroquinate dehydratase [Actinomycetota bacterium]|nr:type II 3-dehydroquinate dehydratase [Actinomycetota bacterium]